MHLRQILLSDETQVVLISGQWNHKHLQLSTALSFLKELQTVLAAYGLHCPVLSTQLIEEEDVALYIGEAKLPDGPPPQQGGLVPLALPPSELPVIAIAHGHQLHCCSISGRDLISSVNRNDCSKIMLTLLPLIEQLQLPLVDTYHNALRIFVAGDKSSAGKSSVCCGILGRLLRDYQPHELAYIKPATQSESVQLIQRFCQLHSIQCRPVGPLVYYRGFTRAFLAGETESSEELLEACGDAVNEIARGKKVVLVDGVGFPAVGSICGTSNAAVAKACHAQGVILVGGPGVGAAVDSFNMNRTYFESEGVAILGAVFNKLSETGYYSLENCKEQLEIYFHQVNRTVFGFVPMYPNMARSNSLDYVDGFIDMFARRVDVSGIVHAARSAQKGTNDRNLKPVNGDSRPAKRAKTVRSRSEIERAAISSGAAPSA